MNSLQNTIIIYIIIILALVIIKPNFVYCHKTKKFKPFGCNEGQTFLSLQIISVASAVLVYMIMDIFYNVQ